MKTENLFRKLKSYRYKNFIEKIILINILGLTTIPATAEIDISKNYQSEVDKSYVIPKVRLSDYILDTGDALRINFIKTPSLTNIFVINQDGEIYLPRIKRTYVRGLTIPELNNILLEKYKEFLINPEIDIEIKSFKLIRVSVRGEVKQPGIFTFSRDLATQTSLNMNSANRNSPNSILEKDILNNFTLKKNNFGEINRENFFQTTLSNAIYKAGGITSYSDLSRIELSRKLPNSKGGDREKRIVNLIPFLKNEDFSADIRIYDDDFIFIPRLKEPDPKIVPLSVLNGISPSFMSVTISGRIQNPGQLLIPTEGSLSDVMILSGPRLPLSGNVFLLRYKEDGTILRKKIKYSSKAKPGSQRNPFLKKGDLINVKNSILGKSSGVVKAVTDPFIGIYATYETIDKILN